MSQKQSDVLNYLSRLLSPSEFEDFSPNGLQVNGKNILNRVAFAVSATQDSISKALAWDADALIVHHGLFWKHEGARPITGPWGERVKLCIKNDLNLFSYHLPLDGHGEIGNAASLARKIGLTSLQPFALYKNKPMGMKGIFASPATASELKILLENVLEHPVILASANPQAHIHTMGIITGGANNEWSKARDENLDAYCTGEISEYNWHDAIEAGVHYYAGGHHATERFGIVALKEKLNADFPDLECEFFDSENPA